MKTLTSLLTLLLVAGTLFFSTQNVQAQTIPTMPTARTTLVLNNTAQHRVTFSGTAGSKQRNLATKNSALLEVAGGIGLLFLADIAVGTVVGLGNMYAAVAGSGQLGWGIVGSLFFGGHTLLGLALLGTSGTVEMGATMLLVSGLLTALSIWNVASGLSKTGRSHYRRRRYHRRSRNLGPFGKTNKGTKPLLNATL